MALLMALICSASLTAGCSAKALTQENGDAAKEVQSVGSVHTVDLERIAALRGAYPVITPIPQKNEEESSMVIVTNVSQITKGNGEKLIERFNKVGKVEAMEGFLGLEVLMTENTKEYDEVSVVTRWANKESFQAWTRSEAFRESHSHRQTPEYIISNKIVFYDVKVVRDSLPQTESVAQSV